MSDHGREQPKPKKQETVDIDRARPPEVVFGEKRLEASRTSSSCGLMVEYGDIGPKRDSMQDRGLILTQDGEGGKTLVMVVDGMGGEHKGDVAAEILVETVRERKANGDASLAECVIEAEVRMEEVVANDEEEINRGLDEFDRKSLNMGAVFSAAELRGRELDLDMVGDAGGLVIRDGRIVHFMFPQKRGLNRKGKFVSKVGAKRGVRTDHNPDSLSGWMRDVYGLAKVFSNNPDWPDGNHQVESGDTVILFTDGLKEAIISDEELKPIEQGILYDKASHAETMDKLSEDTWLGKKVAETGGDPIQLMQIFEEMAQGNEDADDNKLGIAWQIEAPSMYSADVDLVGVGQMVGEFGNIRTSDGQWMTPKDFDAIVDRAVGAYLDADNNIDDKCRKYLRMITNNGGLRDKVTKLLPSGALDWSEMTRNVEPSMMDTVVHKSKGTDEGVPTEPRLPAVDETKPSGRFNRKRW